MGFTSDITPYKEMLEEYDRRGREMRQARERRLASYMRSSYYEEPERPADYYTSVNGRPMNREQYYNYTKSMYEANGEEYPGQMHESLAAIYASPM